jgi:hypothetical protein
VANILILNLSKPAKIARSKICYLNE